MPIVIGRYFEDFTEGEEFNTLGRTVTEADIVNFCGVSGDFHPLHTDAEYAKKSRFGSRIAHGMCGFVIATGLLVRLNLYEETLVAFYDIDHWRFRAPIMVGDTVHVKVKIVEKRESNKGGQGMVAFELDVINQHGHSVMGGIIRAIIKKRI